MFRRINIGHVVNTFLSHNFALQQHCFSKHIVTKRTETDDSEGKKIFIDDSWKLFHYRNR